jgi:hypothetical protein
MTDWHSGEWLKMGIADVEQLANGTLVRTPFLPYVQMLQRWQTRLNRPTVLDEDPFDKAVNLGEVTAAAAEMNVIPDANWH